MKQWQAIRDHRTVTVCHSPPFFGVPVFLVVVQLTWTRLDLVVQVISSVQNVSWLSALHEDIEERHTNQENPQTELLELQTDRNMQTILGKHN